MNVALKIAIVRSEQQQGRIAELARIREVRLSKIVRGHVEPTDRERAALARVLGVAVPDLFPQPESVTA